MGTTLATKADLEPLATQADAQRLEHEMALMRKDLEHSITAMRKDLEHIGTTITLRMGSIVVVGLGILFAALRLTQD